MLHTALSYPASNAHCLGRGGEARSHRVVLMMPLDQVVWALAPQMQERGVKVGGGEGGQVS